MGLIVTKGLKTPASRLYRAFRPIILMPLLSVLRAETSDLHRRLDANLDFDSMMESKSSLANYLSGFERALTRCEARLDWSVLAQRGLPEVELRKERYENLRRDLRSLGCEPTGPAPAAAAGFEESVGIVYVLEGSVHGGRVMEKEARDRLGEPAVEWTRFFRGFEDRTPALWGAFVGWLERFPDDSEQQRMAGEAANWAFSVFIDNLIPNPENPTGGKSEG